MERKEYASKLALMDDAALSKEAERKIWAADACYAEAERRGKREIYADAWKRAAESAR
jgi:hypothetical protein